MPVPEEIRKVPRPTNTVVIDQGREGPRRYAVRERQGVRYVRGGNPQPLNGRIIGHIVEGEFRPIQQRLESEAPDMRSYGAVALARSCSVDVMYDLQAVYAVDEAWQVMALAILRVLRPGLPATRVLTEYNRTFVGRFYPGLAMSAGSIGKFKRKLGENFRHRQKFYELRMKAVMAEHHIAIDGTLRQDSSTVNDLSSYSRKAAAHGFREVSVLYAYDVELGEPLCATVYPGNVIDQSSFASFIRGNSISRGIVVADRGFPAARIKKELAASPDLHYLIPIKRNDKRITAYKVTEFEGLLPGIEAQVLYRKVSLSGGKFLYAFRDRSRAAAEEANYLSRAKRSGKDFDLENYEKSLRKGGLIVFESDVDMAPAVAYKCYADRWLIELVFRHYKTDICDNRTQVQGDYAVWGDEFINFIATLLTCRIVRKLENAGLLESMSYRDVMDDLSSAWRMVDAPLEPRSDDGCWVHTTKGVFGMLEALGLSKPPLEVREPKERRKPGRPRVKLEMESEFVGPKRPRGRPRGSKNK